jgi:hypothetical protein
VLCSDSCNNIHFSIVFFLGFCVAATEAHGLKKILMEVGVNEKMSSLIPYFRRWILLKYFWSILAKISRRDCLLMQSLMKLLSEPGLNPLRKK